MGKKIICWCTIALFIGTICSCTSVGTYPVREIIEKEKKNPGQVKILEIMKKSGQLVVFEKASPVTVNHEGIRGRMVPIKISVSLADGGSYGRETDGRNYYLTEGGRKIYYSSETRSKGRRIFLCKPADSAVFVPFSEISYVKIQKPATGKTLILTAALLSVVLSVVAVQKVERDLEESCFIATAAYGSPLHPHVSTLRKFRDIYLTPTPMGRALTALYYIYSPPLAHVVEENRVLKTAVRLSLVPLVAVCESLVPAR